MSLRNTATRWGTGAKLFHWTMAVLIIGTSLFVLHVNDSMPWFKSSPLFFITYIHWHKALGLLALLLLVGRWLWRRDNVVPVTAPLTPVEHRWSHRVHIGLYGLMLIVPLSGWIASSAFGSGTNVFGLFTIPPIIPKTKPLVGPAYWVHFGLAWGLLALVSAHVFAAFWHHDRRRDNVLRAMWFGQAQPRQPSKGSSAA
ncbi:cytochrome b [Polymorphobacter sp.]|uniref:cytochrome b n=1 Tax=Polymorphobacter sp. TaxID=1909290 RepID=UPI003F70C053